MRNHEELEEHEEDGKAGHSGDLRFGETIAVNGVHSVLTFFVLFESSWFHPGGSFSVLFCGDQT